VSHDYDVLDGGTWAVVTRVVLWGYDDNS